MKNSIILNETEYVKNLIDSKSLNGKPFNTLRYVAKYLYSLGRKPQEIREEIESFLLECDPNVNIVAWDSKLDAIARNAGKYPINDVGSIGVTQKEIEACKTAGAMTYQRLAFSMLCVAKYYSIIIPGCDGWVNRHPRDIFSLANVSKPVDVQSMMERQLCDKGLIQLSNKVDSYNSKVLFIDKDGEPVINVTIFRNLGYLYESYIKKGRGFSTCKVCGATFRQNSNRHMYCTTCSKKVYNDKNNQRVKSHRLKHVENTSVLDM